jgi:hypothetical protein
VNEVVAQWSASRPLYVVAGFAGIVFVLLVLAMLDDSDDLPIGPGIGALVIVGGLALLVTRLAARSKVVLTRSQLKARSWRGTDQTIDLDQVRAVAVVRALPGWAMFIWPADGRPIRLAAPSRVFTLKSQSRAAPTAAYWSAVARSPLGTAAAQVYQQVVNSRGPANPVAQVPVQALIAHDRSLFAGSNTRWWSPNGEYGTAP